MDASSLKSNATTGREDRPRRATACPSRARPGGAGWLGIRSSRQRPLATVIIAYHPPRVALLGGASTHHTERRDAGGRSVGLERIRGAAPLQRRLAAIGCNATPWSAGSPAGHHSFRLLVRIRAKKVAAHAPGESRNVGRVLPTRVRIGLHPDPPVFRLLRISGATSRSRALRASTKRSCLYLSTASSPYTLQVQSSIGALVRKT